MESPSSAGQKCLRSLIAKCHPQSSQSPLRIWRKIKIESLCSFVGDMKTYAVLAVSVFAQATGNVFLSKGMKGIHSVGSMVSLFPQVAGSPTIWVGTSLLLLALILFAAALSWEDLSFVVPAISVEVVVNVAFANYFLNEPVSSVRWTGALLISIGVILVLRSGRRKTASANETTSDR